MGLRVIGAGMGRTGTLSLKLALERLLGAPCYHMAETFKHPEHVPVWQRAARGELPDWDAFLSGYSATIDWPAAAFWPELSAAYPDALVLLSVRDAESWWESARATIFDTSRERPLPEPHRDMIESLHRSRGIAGDRSDKRAMIDAYLALNERVARSVPDDRLLTWHLGDGWGPLCDALDLPRPDDPFPHANTRDAWRARRP